jgi:3-hydroxyacyl-CoA dehydrogenase
MTTVTLNKHHNTGIITINNPPVNALSQKVREDLVNCIKSAKLDTEILSIIIIFEGKTFVVGADIKEFNSPPRTPYLLDIIHMIEDSSIPIIATMHGNALGGGLEIALGCHYRIATQKTLLRLPEIKIGLLPGSLVFTTKRLCRVN